MVDNSIAYKSIIMRCDCVETGAFSEIASEVEIVFYKAGMEEIWAQVQKAAGEFADVSYEQVISYFMGRYGDKPEELERRCIFLKEKKTGAFIGTCMAWFVLKGKKIVPVLHWLAVADDFSGKGYARMLITQVIKLFEEYAPDEPIYLHTQPWSYRAIKLYNDFGFNIAKSDTYGTAVNEYEESMLILQKCMEKEAFAKLQRTSVE